MNTIKMLPPGFIPENLAPYEIPEDYGGAHFHGFYTVYGIHRDSDSVERANFIALARIAGFKSPEEIPNCDPRDEGFDPDQIEDPIIVTRAGHWAVGWVDTLRIHSSADPQVLQALDAAIAALEDYPLVDEEIHSEIEWNEAIEYWESMSIRDRVRMIQDANDRSRGQISIFAARRSELPEDPAGRLFEALTSV